MSIVAVPSANRLVGSWLSIPPPSELRGVYALGYRFTDRLGELWSDRFTRVKNGTVTSEAVKAMSRVLEDAVPSLLNDLGVDPKDAAFVSAVRSGSSQESQRDIVTFLARSIARKLGVLYVPSALSKNPHPSMHQSRMRLQERRDTQVRANWRCKRLARPHVFVFDDVTTSGSTFAAIGRAALKSNPEVLVYGVSFAKTENIQYILDLYGEEPSNSHIPSRWNRLWNGLTNSNPVPAPSYRMIEANQLHVPRLHGSVEDADNGLIAVSWAALSLPDVSYAIEISRSGQFWKLIDCGRETSVVYEVDTDENAVYGHRVRASSGTRIGPWSGTVEVEFLTRTPSEVKDLRSIPGELGTVRVVWAAPGSAGRAPLIRYEVQHLDGDWHDISSASGTPGNRDSRAIHRYERLEELSYRVRPVNSMGPGPWSYTTVPAEALEAAVSRSLDSTGKPQFVSADLENGTVEMAWRPAGDSPGASYQLERRINGTVQIMDLDRSRFTDDVDLEAFNFIQYTTRASFLGLDGAWSYPAVLFTLGSGGSSQGIEPLVPRPGVRDRSLWLLECGDRGGTPPLKAVSDIWALAELLHKESVPLRCRISDVNTGGLEVWWGEVPGFVPFSRSLSGPGARSDSRIGEVATFDIIDVRAPGLRQRRSGQLVLAEREVDPWTDAGERYLVGSVVTGTVVGLKEYGAFVRLEPGITGLIHKSEFIAGEVCDPSGVVSLCQQVDVEVLRVIPPRRRMRLRFRGPNGQSSLGPS